MSDLNYFSDDENVDENASNPEESEDEAEINMADAIGEDTDEEIENESKAEADAENDDESLPLDLADQEDSDEEEEESYLQKFDSEVNKNYIMDYHPECEIHTQAEILAMAQVVRDQFGNIIDEFHRTLPFITKFERARIIGQRASQLNSGSKPFITDIPDNIIDGYLIAEMELEYKAMPFIIRRPLPNGGSEYWKIKDLQNILSS
jgi:DNA-directed RNA polymerase subunit K/omega